MLNYFTYDYGDILINIMKVINIRGLLLIAIVVVIALIKKNNSVISHTGKNNWIYISLALVVFIGAAVRVYMLGNVPVDLAPDEASVYYDALCLVNYGTNRLGQVNAVYFNTWEFAGQSPAMATLASFFIRVFGNSIFVFRLSQAVPAIMTVLLAFFIGKKLADPLTGLIAAAILAISPWHIMMSRWALDCNLSAFATTVAVCALLYSFDNNGKMTNIFYLYCIFAGLSLYTYAPTNIMMFIFTLAVYIVLLAKKRIDYKIFIPANIILFIIALPMIGFVVINILGLPSFESNFLTIPYMEYFRSDDISGNIVLNLFENIGNLYDIGQRVVLYPQFSVMYVFSIPLIIMGIIGAIKKFKDKYILVLWLVASAIQMGRIGKSGMWVVVNLAATLPYFIAIGITEIVTHIKITKWLFTALYTIAFAMFLVSYFIVMPETTGVKIGAGQKDAIEYAQSLNVDKIYFSEYNGTNDAFIYCALNNQHSPSEYKEKTVVNPNMENWKYMKQYDNIVFFENIYDHSTEDNVAFVLFNYIDNVQYFIDTGYNIRTFRNFSVAYKE